MVHACVVFVCDKHAIKLPIGMRVMRAYNAFLRAKAVLLSARLTHRNSVRLSVCPSHGWIRQKRSKLGSPNFHRQLLGRL